MFEWISTVDTSQGPKYQAIAEAITAAIRDGVLEPGTQLPTHRDLADAVKVTVGTVSRAYAQLRSRGLISGEVGRGTFVLRQSGERLPLQAVSGQPGVIRMNHNVPLYAIGPDLAAGLRGIAASRGLDELLKYCEPSGMWSHRVAGAELAREQGIAASAEQVVVCAGAQHAIAVALSAVASAGDRIGVTRVTYPAVIAVAQAFGFRLVPLDLDRAGLLPEALEAACRNGGLKALYCNPTVHNPTCSVLSTERRQAIAAIAGAHDLTIVEDNTYLFLAPDESLSFFQLAPERTFAIVSLSKALAGGLRIAFLLHPERHQAAVVHRIWGSVWMASPLMAELASNWITDGTYRRISALKREAAAERQALVAEQLCDVDYWHHPQAFHFWLPLPEHRRADCFADNALRHGVAVTPAHDFAVARGQIPNGVRVCLGAEDERDRLARGLEILADLLRRPDLTRVRF